MQTAIWRMNRRSYCITESLCFIQQKLTHYKSTIHQLNLFKKEYRLNDNYHFHLVDVQPWASYLGSSSQNGVNTSGYHKT